MGFEGEFAVGVDCGTVLVEKGYEWIRLDVRIERGVVVPAWTAATRDSMGARRVCLSEGVRGP